MNSVVLIGNVTKDVEVITTSNGITKCNFGIAVNERIKGGEVKTNFFNIVTWRGLAENCGKYLKKGKKICVSGSLDNRKFTGKDGIERTITEIIADSIEFLSTDENKSKTSSNPILGPISDDNLPFDV